jgi:predicted dienelactone hydrolase
VQRRLGKAGGQGERRRFIKESTTNPENIRNRPRDVSFVIDQLSRDGKLSVLADVDHIGVGGHSFGAYTGFAIAGMTIDLPDAGEGGVEAFGDRRVKAVVAMSPQGAGVMGITSSSWDKVAIPVLSLTGTRDYGQGERAAAWRREGFDATKGVEAMLVVIRDATHGTFAANAGSRLTGAVIGKDHDAHIRYVKMVTTAYFDAYVRGDQSALTWLKSGALKTFDEGACAVEFKAAGGEKKEGPTVAR